MVVTGSTEEAMTRMRFKKWQAMSNGYNLSASLEHHKRVSWLIDLFRSKVVPLILHKRVVRTSVSNLRCSGEY